ncbi:TolC family protein [Parapedobacter sp. ISTM3]|uniref:Outer membrane protein n=1 Tax=Parapedobacter luteus TaxID=623280 RepID=A0A1T5F9K5_9SPHI|nr:MULTISPECIES: TolC family protein [Parapedobacter]MBK1442064.1 TolC family protein [Parapedobacter sp. ISTM3]SKB92836.1 outer membrane protein [Parapedobacter luteus]
MFDRIRYIIYLGVALGLGNHAAIAQDTLTLERCIELALENNLDVQQSEIRTQNQAINLRQARQNLIPDLTARLGHSFEVGRAIDPETNQYLNNVTNRYGNQSLSSSVVLFDGLRMFRAITQQAYAYRATQLDERYAKEQIALNVASAYIQTLAARDVVAQTDSLVAVTRRQVERRTLLFEQGAEAPADYYDLKGQYANDLNNLNDAKTRFNEALVNLFQLINLPFDAETQLVSLQELPANGGTLTDDALYQTAAERLSVIKAADNWVKEAQFGLKTARSSYFPSLSVGGGLTSSYIHGNGIYIDQVRDRVGQNLGFTLSIPILNRFQVRNNVARAKLNLFDAENISRTRRNELQQTTSQALFNLDAAKTQYENLLEQVANYAESFRIAEVRFNAGAINSVEYLIAKNKLDNANANLVIARYQWHLRQRIVDYYNGEMPLDY